MPPDLGADTLHTALQRMVRGCSAQHLLNGKGKLQENISDKPHHQARNKRLLKGFDVADNNEDDMKLDHQQHLFFL